LFSNCCKYNVGKAGKRFRKEAKRQKRLWKTEILPGLKADLARRMDNTQAEDSMEVDKSEIKGAPSKIKPSRSADPSNSDLLSLVDTLFTAADKHTMTAGGVYHSVATHFGWEKVDKTRQKVILKRLKDLINGIVSVGEGLDDEKTKKKKDKEEAAAADLARRMNTYEEEGEDDSKQPAVISPKKRKKNKSSDEEAEFDLEDSDDEQSIRLQPRQLGYSSEKKKRKRILDDSDDE